MSDMKVTHEAHVEDMSVKKQDKPEKGDTIYFRDDVHGGSVRAVVDDISEDGTRMTLSKLKEDE